MKTPIILFIIFVTLELAHASSDALYGEYQSILHEYQAMLSEKGKHQSEIGKAKTKESLHKAIREHMLFIRPTYLGKIGEWIKRIDKMSPQATGDLLERLKRSRAEFIAEEKAMRDDYAEAEQMLSMPNVPQILPEELEALLALDSPAKAPPLLADYRNKMIDLARFEKDLAEQVQKPVRDFEGYLRKRRLVVQGNPHYARLIDEELEIAKLILEGIDGLVRYAKFNKPEDQRTFSSKMNLVGDRMSKIDGFLHESFMAPLNQRKVTSEAKTHGGSQSVKSAASSVVPASPNSDFGPWEKYREAQLETERLETSFSTAAILRGASKKSSQLQLADDLEKEVVPRVEKIAAALDPAQGPTELVRKQISSLKKLAESHLKILRSRATLYRGTSRETHAESEKIREAYEAAKAEWQSIAPKAASLPASTAARMEPTSPGPGVSPARAEVDALSDMAKSFSALYKEIDDKREEALTGKVDKATAASLWQKRFIPENQKILENAKSVSSKQFEKETGIFRKSLVAFDQVLKAELLLYTEARTKARIDDFERKVADFVKAREELETASKARVGNFLAKGGNSAGSQDSQTLGATIPPAPEKPRAGARPEDIDNIFAAAAPKPEPVAAVPAVVPPPAAKVSPMAAPAKPPVPPLSPSDSAAAKCRGALSRYPRVSPSMMTLCRQANDYSAKVMDTYTAIYRGGISKRLMEGILEANNPEKSQCAIQIAEKFRGSMTEKYLRETCL